jgi:hypothetical protein
LLEQICLLDSILGILKRLLVEGARKKQGEGHGIAIFGKSPEKNIILVQLLQTC